MDILLFIQRELFLECSTMMKYFILSTRVSLCTSLYSNLSFKENVALFTSSLYIMWILFSSSVPFLWWCIRCCYDGYIPYVVAPLAYCIFSAFSRAFQPWHTYVFIYRYMMCCWVLISSPSSIWLKELVYLPMMIRLREQHLPILSYLWWIRFIWRVDRLPA